MSLVEVGSTVNDYVKCLANIEGGVFTYNCTIGTIVTKSLFDTGANLNYVSSKLVEILLRNKSNIKLEKLDNNHSVKIADSTIVSCKAKLKMEIAVDDRKYLVEFLVIDSLLFDVIFGCKFMGEKKIVLDVENKKLIFKDQAHPIVGDDEILGVIECRMLPLSIYDKRVIIPARSERIVDVKCDSLTLDNFDNAYKTITCRPDDDSFRRHSVSNSVIKVDEELFSKHNRTLLKPIKLVVANLSKKPLLFRQNDIIGQLTEHHSGDFEEISLEEIEMEQEITSLMMINDENNNITYEHILFDNYTNKSREALVKELHELVPKLNIDEMELSDVEIHKTIQLIKKYSHLFEEIKTKPGVATGVEHTIDVGEHKPINQAPCS